MSSKGYDNFFMVTTCKFGSFYESVYGHRLTAPSECVSKVIIPPTQDRGNPQKRGWNDRYLFVDFATADEAEHAVKAMNGVQSWGVKVRVAMNDVGDSWKVGERQAWDEAQLELQTPDIVPTPGSD